MARAKKQEALATPDAEQAMAEIAAKEKEEAPLTFRRQAPIIMTDVAPLRALMTRLRGCINQMPSPVQDEANMLLAEILAKLK